MRCIRLAMFVLLPTLCLAQSAARLEKRIDAQIEFQKKLADILLAEAPEFRELINISRDLQIAHYQIERAQCLFLIAHDPKRVRQEPNIDYDWTDRNEKELLRSDPRYKSLRTTRDALYQKNQEHSQWPALREKMKSVEQTKQYRQIYEALMKALEQEGASDKK
jgi:hypothetical protein